MHRLGWTCLVLVILVIVAGAVVRVTGSGLGCPDWPTCWGCLIPPTDASQIDVEKLDLEKFKKHATRKGIDPDSITRESVLDEFNPVQTWIEYCNRLVTIPLGFASLALALASIRVVGQRILVVVLSWLSLLDVIANAVLGAIVVRSGLQPGIITLHMALAFLLVVFLVTIIHLTRKPDSVHEGIQRPRWMLIVAILFFVCLFVEGILGSQLRETTDELMLGQKDLPRNEWIEVLSPSLIFKIHRTFSWSLLVLAGGLIVLSKRYRLTLREPYLILMLVLGMMLMGIILGHVSVYPAIQVAHVGLTSVLLAIAWNLILKLIKNTPGEAGNQKSA